MAEYVKKKIGSAKILRIVLIVLAVASVGSFIASGVADEMETLGYVPMAVVWILLICGLVYYISFSSFMSSMKLLRENGIATVADDINLSNPTLPKSKIYCGENALFCKKPCAVIPYAEIAWIYLYERKAYGIVTVEKAVIVYTKDGRKYSLRSDVNEFQWLLENYIVKHSPDVVIGYGAEQKARYKQLNPQSSNTGKKVKKICGIVLMCLAVVLLVALIVNIDSAEIIPIVVLIAVFFVSGVGLFLFGNKK